MVADLLIRSARLPSGDVGDVAVSKGSIVDVGRWEGGARDTVDARGLLLLPGLVDTQVHFREPGLEQKEDLETGTRAAILGGVTSVLEMPNTSPTTTTPEALADKVLRAQGRAHCDIGFFFGATAENADQLAEFERLPGTPGIKVFVGSSTGDLLVHDDGDLRRVFGHGRRRIAVHAEDESRNRVLKATINPTDVRQHPEVRDAESAEIATRRVLAIAHAASRPVHILHISTASEPGLIAEAKRQGQAVTAEVTPQHLWFSADDYARLGTRLQMNPPIRASEHQGALRAALRAGVFDVFGSDHAPHTLEEKAKPYPASPSGMPGVQTILPVLLTLVRRGEIDLPTVVRMASVVPARLYGIRGKQGLTVGGDADLTLVDPDVPAQVRVASRCGWHPYEDEGLYGRVERVWLRGREAVRGGELVAPPAGQVLSFDAASA